MSPRIPPHPDREEPGPASTVGAVRPVHPGGFPWGRAEPAVGRRGGGAPLQVNSRNVGRPRGPGAGGCRQGQYRAIRSPTRSLGLGFFPWVAAPVPTRDWPRVERVSPGYCERAVSSNFSPALSVETEGSGRRTDTPKTAPAPQTPARPAGAPQAASPAWEGAAKPLSARGCPGSLPLPGKGPDLAAQRCGCGRPLRWERGAEAVAWGQPWGAPRVEPPHPPWEAEMARRWLRREARRPGWVGGGGWRFLSHPHQEVSFTPRPRRLSLPSTHSFPTPKPPKRKPPCCPPPPTPAAPRPAASPPPPQHTHAPPRTHALPGSG